MGSWIQTLERGTCPLNIAMTYFRQISLQNDSVSSSSDASLYVDLSLDTGFNTISDRRVTSSSETSSSVTESSVNSENLANQLRESPWVTSTTTEENIYSEQNQSRTNMVKNNNNNTNTTSTTSNNADMFLF